MTAALSSRHLTKTFGQGDVAVAAVRDVELDVEAGEVVLIDGPSGSGKTTLLLMLGGLLAPTAGTVAVAGTDLWALPERRRPALRARQFGFVFQDFNLLGALSVTENVELAANLAGVSGRAARQLAAAALDRVGLTKRAGFRPEQLSGGEKQRVAVARALVNDPAVILADEPTANLDSGNGRQVARLLQRLAVDDHRSVIIVTHDSRLHHIADRLLWLEDGALRQLDTLVADPVCHMSVTPADNPHLQHEDVVWWFCSPACRDDFAADPGRFTQAAAGGVGPALGSPASSPAAHAARP